MTAVLRVDILGIGLLGPGWSDWASGRSTLAQPQTWASAPTQIPAPTRLPPAERRRAGTIVKLAIAAADQAAAQAAVDTSTHATVFTASSGDGANCHALCEALATPERLVSPTRFTNSVHNAAAGYWHIATASRAPSTSLCAHDASFGAGLLEAASQCVTTARPVLLVAADAPYPAPLADSRPLPDSFAAAFVLAPAGTPGALASIALSLTAEPATPLTDAAHEALRGAIPAARALPLLALLAREASGTVVVEYQPDLALHAELTMGTPR